MSALDEVDALLQSLQALKPPGITKSKMEALNALCVPNVKLEAALVHKIASHFQRTLPTHKLGILYVVDAVTRQWIDKATQMGQVPGASAPEGTFAAGVHKMTELLPVLMNELVLVAPDNQKEKIIKLIDIWERGNTFPRPMLLSYKEKFASSSNHPQTSSIPPPANNPVGYQQSAPVAAPQQPMAAQPPKQLSAVELLTALAQQQSTPQAPAPIPQAPAAYAQQQAPPSYPGVNGSNGFAPPAPAYPAAVPPQAPAPTAAGAAPGGAAPPDPAALIQILQGLAAANLPPDQIAQILSAMGVTQLPNLGAAAPAAAPAPQYPPNPPQGPADYGRSDANGGQYRDSRGQDRSDYRDQRGRSRSPDYNRRSPFGRRDSPTYGTYDPSVPSRDGRDGRDGRDQGFDRRDRGPPRRGNDYRQRSPMGGGRDKQPSPPRNVPPRAPGQKFIEIDRSMPRNHIRVLSRTLFVGGVTGTEADLTRIFSRFGSVQSVIVNAERRHAFVKMSNRQDSLNAKNNMDRETDPDVLHKARSTRWGVGFGPRECNDYNTGVSTIPLDALTDADRKWMLTAEHGGTGGRPIEAFMVVEEPDIEIGAGVSSKAISRRVVADPGAPRRHPGPREQGPRGGRYNDRPARPTPPRRASPAPRPEANTVGVPPQVPQFGFQLPGFR